MTPAMTLANPWLLIAALNGLAAVVAGGWGWHGLAADDSGRQVFLTGVQYHMWHALALLAVAWLAENRFGRAAAWVRVAGGLFAAGIVLFSGSLYYFGVAGEVPLSGVAPAGGLALIGGWACLAVAAVLRE